MIICKKYDVNFIKNIWKWDEGKCMNVIIVYRHSKINNCFIIIPK